MGSRLNNDTSWIRKTLRRQSLRNFRKQREIPQNEQEDAEKSELGSERRASIAERRATLAEKKQELKRQRRESKKQQSEYRKNNTARRSKASKTLRVAPNKDGFGEVDIKRSKASKTMQMMMDAAKEALETSVKPAVDTEKVARVLDNEAVGGDIEIVEVSDSSEEEESSSEEETSEYDTETESESEEEPEDDMRELNELNFNKLLQVRVQATDYQLESFCARYIFLLKEKGVREVHELADSFELICRQIYEPMLKRINPGKRKGTLRRVVADEAEQKQKLSIPKEFPIEHEAAIDFFLANGIQFKDEEERKGFLSGLHIDENCCFLQFLLLKYRDLIIDQHLERWTKERSELETKNIGCLILEEYFMPPMKVEPKLDEELVKFSKLMANREHEINNFKKKMMKKEVGSVGYNILKKELQKYVKELEDKINVSEIYFAAAIMRVKQQQQRELERIYDIIDEEENNEI